jgi:hypothetical protein
VFLSVTAGFSFLGWLLALGFGQSQVSFDYILLSGCMMLVAIVALITWDSIDFAPCRFKILCLVMMGIVGAYTKFTLISATQYPVVQLLVVSTLVFIVNAYLAISYCKVSVKEVTLH